MNITVQREEGETEIEFAHRQLMMVMLSRVCGVTIDASELRRALADAYQRRAALNAAISTAEAALGLPENLRTK